jgi:hypothetical protein
VQLAWRKEPPAQAVYTLKRKSKSATSSDADIVSAKRPCVKTDASSALKIMQSILERGVHDTTSVVCEATRTQYRPNILSYRFNRVCSSPCAHGETHTSNGGYLHLNSEGHMPVVKYVCESSRCPNQPKTLPQQCHALAQQWAEAEGVSCDDDFESLCSTASVSSADSMASNAAPGQGGASAYTMSMDYDVLAASDNEADLIADAMTGMDYDVPAAPGDDEDWIAEMQGDAAVPKAPSTSTSDAETELHHPELQQLLHVLKLSPESSLKDSNDMASMAWHLKQGIHVNTDQDRWVGDLLKIWHCLCKRADTKHKDAAPQQQTRQKQWDETKSDRQSKEDASYDAVSFVANVVAKVCDWRSASDLDFDMEFVHSVHKHLISPAKTVLAQAAKAAQRAASVRDRALEKLAEEETDETASQTAEATDAWRKAVDFYVLHDEGQNMLIKPAVFRYMSTFFTLVVTATKTEVVQQMFHIQTTGGEDKHVMSGFVSRLKYQFLDAHGIISKLAAEWLQQAHACSGFTMDPEYVHIKGDQSLKSSLLMPQFNTFCGFAIDAMLTPEEARNFKYGENIVKRVTDFVLMLCNGDENVQNYLLRWIAAPLQKRGHRTNVMVIHKSAAKGVGKGLFWAQFIGRKIYGGIDKARPHCHSAYDQVKDIEYLVGNHNEGLIGKVWLNMDECGIFDGATKQNEKVKSMVTEDTIQVNQKYLTLMTYFNCLNFLLTSNKSDPIKVEHEDRRFFVVESKTKQVKSFFTGLDGMRTFLIDRPETVKHFYAYLMQIPMGDFHEIDPPMTEAKQTSMSKHMPVEAKFLQALCLRLHILATVETRPLHVNVSADDSELQSKQCASEKILTNEFVVHKQAISDAFEFYCKYYKKEARAEAVTDFVKRQLVTKAKSNPTHFACYGTGRPLVMPSVQNLEAQLRAKNLWDDQFMMDMTRTKDEQYNTYGLYYGQGLKVL